MRCISGNPRKEDGESAEVIFQRLHYTSISDFLVNASKRRVDALTSCRDTYPGIAEDIQWQKAVHHSYLHPVLTVQSHKPAHPEQRSFQCPRTFDSMHAMRTHCARTHKISFVRPDLQKGTARREVGITQHCLNGLPTCKHCGFSFRKWSGFKGHILSACPVLHAQTAAEGGDHDGSNGFKTESNGKAAPLDSDTMSPCRDGAVTRPLNKDNLQSGCERPLAAEVPAADATATGSAEQSAAGPEPSTAASKIPQPPNDPADLPLSRQAEVLQTCKAGWVDLAAAQGEKLKFYCVICSPWCAPATGGLQSHMRRSHPTQWEMDRAIMHELKSHYRLKYKGLCKACGFQPTGAQKGALHPPKCVAYYQACLLHRLSSDQPGLRTQNDDTRAAGSPHPLRPAPPLSVNPDADGGSRGSEDQNKEPPTQVAQARGKRRQSVLPCDQGQPRLEQQLGQLGQRSPGQADGSSVGRGGSQPPRTGDALEPTPRGRSGSDSSRQCLPVLPGDADDRNLPPDPVIRGPLLRHCPAVAEAPRRDAGEAVSLSPGHSASGLHDRVSREAPSRLGGGVQRGLLEGGLAPGVGHEPVLDVLQVERRTAGGDHRHESHPHHPCPDPGQRSSTLETPERLQIGSQVQGHTPLGRELRLQHPHISDDGGHQRPGGRSALRDDAPLDRLQRDPPDVHPHRKGAPTPPATGDGVIEGGRSPSSCNAAAGQTPAATLERQTGSGGDGGVRPHSVFLKNPHNVCYLNATVTGLLWAGDRSRAPVYGAFASAFRSLRAGTARRPIYVPGLLPWASLLRRWTQLAQQQDASEFLAFLLQKLRSEAFAGTWAARLNDGDIVDCRDRGAIPPPLPLTVPEQTQGVSLQSF